MPGRVLCFGTDKPDLEREINISALSGIIEDEDLPPGIIFKTAAAAHE